MGLLTFQPCDICQEESNFFPDSITSSKQKSPFYLCKTFISRITILMGGDTLMTCLRKSKSLMICLRKILDFLDLRRRLSLCPSYCT